MTSSFAQGQQQQQQQQQYQSSRQQQKRKQQQCRIISMSVNTSIKSCHIRGSSSIVMSYKYCVSSLLLLLICMMNSSKLYNTKLFVVSFRPLSLSLSNSNSNSNSNLYSIGYIQQKLYKQKQYTNDNNNNNRNLFSFLKGSVINDDNNDSTGSNDTTNVIIGGGKGWRNTKQQRFTVHKSSKQRRFLSQLSAKKDNNNESNNDVDNNTNSLNKVISNVTTIILDLPPIKAITDISVQIKDKWEMTTTPLIKAIPEPITNSIMYILNFIKSIWNSWTKIRWYLVTFTAGAVISIVALIVPLQDSVSQLSQPVTLFETILHDLDQAYVEPVDTQKLFETGVSAMLQSLDPYTEFESQTAATALSESIDGRYGGVGLVISGIPQVVPASIKASSTTATPISSPTSSKSSSLLSPMLNFMNPTDNNNNNKLLPLDAQKDNQILNEQDGGDDDSKAITMDYESYDVDEVDIDDIDSNSKNKKKNTKIDGVRVMSAFEGYAFDYGIRVGDKLIQIDDLLISSDVTVEQVRNKLRGEPGTNVDIIFERDGVPGIQTVTMPRSVVRIRDVKLATLIGNPTDGIGYIQLSGFASDAGREVRNAIRYLQQSTEDATNGEQTLHGLILDLRGNPGGLLTSAVDVASLLVPKGSDIVSAKGRGFAGVIYRSRVEPIIDTSRTKLVVMVNGYTASAAEIVSGAIQDLDVGIIVGADRTFGKGLVQNVEELPYNTALKFTVAKYYTPSGRCIQGIKYTEGGGVISDDNDGRYVASKVSEKDRTTFYTKAGRIVKDGGGVEADYKVTNPKASALEITLLRSGILNDFAAEWSKKNELTTNFQVDEDTYKQFQTFVAEKQKIGDIKLEAFYDRSLQELKGALKRSGYKGSERSVEQLQARILQDMKNDYDKYRADIKEDISTSILARYLPESMLIERNLKTDIQVIEVVKLLKNNNKFDTLLAKGNTADRLLLSTTTNNKNEKSKTNAVTSSTTIPTISTRGVPLNSNFAHNNNKIESNSIRTSISW